MNKGKYTYDIKEENYLIRFSIDKDSDVDTFDTVKSITKQLTDEGVMDESIFIQKEILTVLI